MSAKKQRVGAKQIRPPKRRKKAAESRREPPAAARASDDGEERASKTTGPLVLIVDDYQDAREMCAEYLQYVGFRVLEARNGIEAVDQATSKLPDIVLMDLSLPGMDGWEATRRLKADARTKSIPVVALTGHALDGFSQGAMKAGCDAFITKPCLPDRLVVEINKLLKRNG